MAKPAHILDTPSQLQPHALEADAVLRHLRSSQHGLSAAEAAERLRTHGPNTLPPPPRRTALQRLAEQFNNALILFLIAAAVLAGVLGHWVDAGVIIAVVLVNATVGFMQEGKAEQALDALQAMLAPTARVLRDGQRSKLDVAELVPGDVVLLEAGDRVPADVRLLHARGVLIDEAILTGESVTSEKTQDAVAADAALGDRHCMAYSGTLVAAGQATGIVTATGSDTEIGKINQLLGSVNSLSTPLLRQINQFAKLFTAFAGVLAVVLFGFITAFRGYAWLEALMVVVALAVSLVPEGLPAVITITLAIGVRRMAARHAIVRRLPAVETLGSTSVICSDKTGTLTRNEMTVRHVVSAVGLAHMDGAGYAPEGAVQLPEGEHAASATHALLTCGVLCNDAHLRQRDGRWLVDGDPMEGALLAAAMKAGMQPEAMQQAQPRIDLIPFDARYRFMATLHQGGDANVLQVKGAPEELLALSRSQRSADGSSQALDSAEWQAAIDAAAARGERVLGFARKPMGQAGRVTMDDVAVLEFLGIMGFIDPPRPEAISAVAECRSAGIGVKMITGDHAATASAIAAQLGIADAPKAMIGQAIEAIDDADLLAIVADVDVFARASPEHKLRIVRALQARGAVVAMTGDGVNDAPSLKQADVGIAMGIKGTEAAKEASQMLLSDDNFASIAAAVNEGRTVYDNIRKVVAWTLPTNGGEALTIILAMLLGMTLPMSAAQILWINMVLTITLGLVLAFEPPEPGVMQRPPRRANAPLISPFMLWRIVLVSLLFTAGAFGVFTWAKAQGFDVATARTMVVNVICVMEIFYLFNVRYLHRTSFTWRGAMGTPAVLWAIGGVIVAQAAFTYLPLMQQLFDTRALGVTEAALIIGIGLALLVVLELEKALLRRLGWFEELALPQTSTKSRL